MLISTSVSRRTDSSQNSTDFAYQRDGAVYGRHSGHRPGLSSSWRNRWSRRRVLLLPTPKAVSARRGRHAPPQVVGPEPRLALVRLLAAAVLVALGLLRAVAPAAPPARAHELTRVYTSSHEFTRTHTNSHELTRTHTNSQRSTQIHLVFSLTHCVTIQMSHRVSQNVFTSLPIYTNIYCIS